MSAITNARQAPPAPVAFHYTQSESFIALLHQLQCSLLVTTYQANKLLVVRAAQGGISTLVRTIDQPMGVAVDAKRLTVGSRKEVWTFANAPDIAPRIEPLGVHDACYLPRSCHVTGDIRIHEVGWVRDELWLVNTRFSCLCTLHPDYSFVPRWRPPFITGLSADDRCHLNGMAIVDNKVKYVTVLGATDTPGGWRDNKASGGCLIDVPSNEIIVRGLPMPHSPRRHDDRLWLLESGKGQLVQVDSNDGRRQVVAELPGFTRGLTMVGPYAFIGLSKIRETSAMDGVPLAQRRNELKCGVAVVDIRNGQLKGLLEFQTAVEEIFDVQLLPGLRFPEVMGFQKDTLSHTFIVPPG